MRLRFEQARLARARALVERAPFGWALSAEDVCAVAEAAVTVWFSAGETVFSEGAPDPPTASSSATSSEFLVEEGSAVETRGDAKHRREAATYRAGGAASANGRSSETPRRRSTRSGPA